MNFKALISFLIVGTSMLYGCSHEQESIIENISLERIYDEEIDAKEFYSQYENYYGVYVTSRTCTHCNLARDYLENYLEKQKSDDSLTKLYVLDVTFDETIEWSDDLDKLTSSLGANQIEDTVFYQTPSIYLINKHVLDNILYKTEDVRSFLESAI